MSNFFSPRLTGLAMIVGACSLSSPSPIPMEVEDQSSFKSLSIYNDDALDVSIDTIVLSPQEAYEITKYTYSPKKNVLMRHLDFKGYGPRNSTEVFITGIYSSETPHYYLDIKLGFENGFTRTMCNLEDTTCEWGSKEDFVHFDSILEKVIERSEFGKNVI